MRKAAIGLALLGALLMALPAAAQTGEIHILVDGILRGDPGDVFNVHTEVVDESLIGATCTGIASTENNASEHPNNDMIFASGGNTAVIPDYEAVANSTTAMAGTLTLGPTIEVSVRLGGAGISSGGVLIILTCAQPEPTTTTTVAATTTTDPGVTTTTAPPVVTTTTAPTGTEEGETPEGGVAAGGGSTASGGGGLGLLMLALGASAIVGAGFLAMKSGERTTRKE